MDPIKALSPYTTSGIVMGGLQVSGCNCRSSGNQFGTERWTAPPPKYLPKAQAGACYFLRPAELGDQLSYSHCRSSSTKKEGAFARSGGVTKRALCETARIAFLAGGHTIPHYFANSEKTNLSTSAGNELRAEKWALK